MRVAGASSKVPGNASCPMAPAPAWAAGLLACWYADQVKITVELDPELYRAVKVEAARADRSVREVLADAISSWLEHLENREDRDSAAAALEEYRRDGGTAASEFFEHLAAEARAAYGKAPTEQADARGDERSVVDPPG